MKVILGFSNLLNVSVPDEDYSRFFQSWMWAYLMKVILGFSNLECERTWWRLFQFLLYTFRGSFYSILSEAVSVSADILYTDNTGRIHITLYLNNGRETYNFNELLVNNKYAIIDETDGQVPPGKIMAVEFNTTFNYISLYRGGQFSWWRKPGFPEENHRPVASHWQTNVVSNTPRLSGIQTHFYNRFLCV